MLNLTGVRIAWARGRQRRVLVLRYRPRSLGVPHPVNTSRAPLGYATQKGACRCRGDGRRASAASDAAVCAGVPEVTPFRTVCNCLGCMMVLRWKPSETAWDVALTVWW